MKDLGSATTVSELIEKLKKLPENFLWYGYDDGSVIITDEKNDEVGYIEPY